jgi:hypothetical protein
MGAAVLGFGSPRSHDGHRVIAVVTGHPGEASAEQPPDLPGDGREHLLRRHPARNQGRDPPQRGLLVGQHTRLLTDQRRTPSLTIAD